MWLILTIFFSLLSAQSMRSAWAQEQFFDFNAEMKQTPPSKRVPNTKVKTIIDSPPGFRVRVIHFKEQHEKDTTHRNNGAHILYVVDGEGTVIVEGRETPVKAGSIVHVPKGLWHDWRTKGEMRVLDFQQPVHTETIAKTK